MRLFSKLRDHLETIPYASDDFGHSVYEAMQANQTELVTLVEQDMPKIFAVIDCLVEALEKTDRKCWDCSADINATEALQKAREIAGDE